MRHGALVHLQDIEVSKLTVFTFSLTHINLGKRLLIFSKRPDWQHDHSNSSDLRAVMRNGEYEGRYRKTNNRVLLSRMIKLKALKNHTKYCLKLKFQLQVKPPSCFEQAVPRQVP